MRGHVPPVSVMCQNIPQQVLEATYNINIVRPRENEDPHHYPTSEELLPAYGYMHGFMMAHGQPDQPCSVHYILKDYFGKQIENVVDKTFFHQENVRVLTRGMQAVMEYQPGSGLVTAATTSAEKCGSEPWKKYGNRNKKKKSHRLHKHLDM
ncbi:Large subunit GTPase 1-like protein [Heterocephalus glaber]|uniref:Large subunit GTPase 1-like protein n=1 Tax=Heterocephalus glaber TaxID=10181 RepID=G5BZT7_HETGA|nr:Large subunit GTPase 1-like protein [Heterocephalus glaber]